MPSVAAPQTVSTDLQQQIFNNPPSNLPSIPPAPVDGAKEAEPEKDASKGVKRGREEEESDEEEPMDEDSDAPMEEASDDED